MAGEPNRRALRDTWRHLTEEERRILHAVLQRFPVPPAEPIFMVSQNRNTRCPK